MGSVYAKESNIPKQPEYQNEKFGNSSDKMKSDDESSEPEVDLLAKLKSVKARVDKVHINGLGRTKDDIVMTQVHDLFEARNIEDVIEHSRRVRDKLESLGCFNRIGIFIDTSKGPDATPEGVEVTYKVHEQRRITGGITTMIGNNEGSVMIRGKLPNILGRGEQFQIDYSHGSKKSSQINISAMKPFFGSRLQKILTTTLFTSSNEFPWSGYQERDKGVLLDLALNPKGSGTLKHNLQYEIAIRDITAAKQASFHVREQSGPTLKSAVRHICSIDKRDESIFPTRGILMQLTSEVAGLGGNIGFIKNELFMQSNWTPHEYLTFQLGIQSGFLRSISNEMQINIADHFFLGGPMNLRGFEMRGCGPQKDGNAIGADFYWASALHLYTPLPFKPSIFGDIFRLHGFINGGNLSNFSSSFGDDYEKSLKVFTHNVRCSTGCGLAMKIANMARIELNFVMPLMFLRSDVLKQFQFGIGMYYL